MEKVKGSKGNLREEDDASNNTTGDTGGDHNCGDDAAFPDARVWSWQ